MVGHIFWFCTHVSADILHQYLPCRLGCNWSNEQCMPARVNAWCEMYCQTRAIVALPNSTVGPGPPRGCWLTHHQTPWLSTTQQANIPTQAKPDPALCTMLSLSSPEDTLQLESTIHDVTTKYAIWSHSEQVFLCVEKCWTSPSHVQKRVLVWCSSD